MLGVEIFPLSPLAVGGHKGTKRTRALARSLCHPGGGCACSPACGWQRAWAPAFRRRFGDFRERWKWHPEWACLRIEEPPQEWLAPLKRFANISEYLEFPWGTADLLKAIPKKPPPPIVTTPPPHAKRAAIALTCNLDVEHRQGSGPTSLRDTRGSSKRSGPGEAKHLRAPLVHLASSVEWPKSPN